MRYMASYPRRCRQTNSVISCLKERAGDLCKVLQACESRRCNCSMQHPCRRPRRPKEPLDLLQPLKWLALQMRLELVHYRLREATRLRARDAVLPRDHEAHNWATAADTERY